MSSVDSGRPRRRPQPPFGRIHALKIVVGRPIRVLRAPLPGPAAPRPRGMHSRADAGESVPEAGPARSTRSSSRPPESRAPTWTRQRFRRVCCKYTHLVVDTSGRAPEVSRCLRRGVTRHPRWHVTLPSPLWYSRHSFESCRRLPITRSAPCLKWLIFGPRPEVKGGCDMQARRKR